MTAEQRRDRSDALYQVPGAAAGIVVAVDAQGRIDYVNDRALRSFGYERAELLGKPLEVLVPRDRAARHVGLRHEFTADPHQRRMGAGLDLAARRKDGTEFPVQITLTPVHTDDGPWVVATIRVTELRWAEWRLRDLGRAYLTLAQMNQAIVRATDDLMLFAETCRIAVEEGGYLGCWVGRLGPDGSVVSVASAGTLDAYIARHDLSVDASLPRGNGPCARALRDGTAYYSADFGSDEATEPWHAAGTEFDIRASATLPLCCGGRNVAALTLYSSVPDTFDEEMRSLLEGLADNVSFALDGFAAGDRLVQVLRERTDLAQRLVAAQEDERARIAADVHDDSVQSLAAVDLRLGLLSRAVAEQAPDLVPAVTQLQDAVTGAARGLRDLLFELEPADPDSRLPDLLDEAAAHIFENTDVRWQLDVEGAGMPADGRHLLPPAACGQALRIAKEAMINVRKHAEADLVTITVSPGVDGVEVSIADDGVGLEPASVDAAPGHRGLATMRDRASVVGGWCRLENTPVGAAVHFWLPYDASLG